MPEVLAKGKILINLDNVLEDDTRRSQLRVALEDDSYFLVNIATDFGIAYDQEMIDHLRDDWFGKDDNGGTWWPGAQPVAGIVRKGLLQAIKQMDDRGFKSVDCYWVCDPGHSSHPHSEQEAAPQTPEVVECTTSWTDRQVTFIIFTPHPPYEHDPHPINVPEDILITKMENGQVITRQVYRHGPP
jgi:hypothetical protein